MGLFRISFFLCRNNFIVLTGHNKDPSRRFAANRWVLYLKFSRNEIDSDLDLATISDKSDSDRVIILLATMDDID